MSAAGNTLARHRRQVRGAHAVVRTDEHVAALEKALLAASGDNRAPCRRKKRIIRPSAQALAEADRIQATLAGQPAGDQASGPVVDLAAYQANYAAAGRAINPATGPTAGDDTATEPAAGDT